MDLIDIDLHRLKLLLPSRIDNLDSRCAKMDAGSGLFEIDFGMHAGQQQGRSGRRKLQPIPTVEPFLMCQGDMIDAQALSSAYLLDYRFVASC